MKLTGYLVPAFLMCGIATIAHAQQMFVYPKKGQSPQQQQRDQGECHGWAVQQSGFNPASANLAPAQSAAPQRGGILRGAAGGAALGAVGGAIGGNAGKGAAIGAGVGALFGGMRRRGQARQQQQMQQQQQAAIQQQQSNYRRALGACLQARGYTVQ